MLVSDTDTRNQNEEFSLDSDDKEQDIDDIIGKLNRATTRSAGDLIASV